MLWIHSHVLPVPLPVFRALPALLSLGRVSSTNVTHSTSCGFQLLRCVANYIHNKKSMGLRIWVGHQRQMQLDRELGIKTEQWPVMHSVKNWSLQLRRTSGDESSAQLFDQRPGSPFRSHPFCSSLSCLWPRGSIHHLNSVGHKKAVKECIRKNKWQLKI